VFYRLGLKIVARARLILAVGALALVLSAVVGVGAFSRLLSGGFDDPASGSSQAKTLLDQQFGGEPDLIFLVHARNGTVDSAEAAAAAQALTGRLSADGRLHDVTSYWSTHSPALRSRDASDGLILGHVVGDDQRADKSAKALLDTYGHLDNSAVTVRIGGGRGTDVGTQVTKDLAVAEGIAVPITVILMIIVFGSLVASLLPLAVGVLAILATFATLNLLTHVTSVSVFAINLATGLGLGLGMDYALLMVSRFREELAKGEAVGDAVARTMATAGRTIAFSALAVAAALSAMMVFPVYFLKSFAYAGVSVTILSAVSALLVLPALLAVLGARVNAGRIRGIRPRSVEAPFWGRLAAAVMRRPVIASVPVIAVLLFMATPLLSVTFGTPDERVLPAGAASHQVGDALRNDFATTPDVIDVLITPALPTEQLRNYQQRLDHLPGVQTTDVTVGGGRPGQPATQRITLTTGLDSASGSAQSLVRQVRALPAPRGSTVLVGGATATLIDAKHAISSHLALAGGLIVVTTFVLLFLFTGSVLQPLRALLGNALTLGATLGTVVWIFQDGHLSSLFGFTPRPTDTAMPVLLFCIAFGLSMDYELFVISRIKELHDAGESNAESVTGGLARTGRIVSTLAALLSVGFFAFATSHVSFIQLFGLGTGMAILIDATLVRGVLVPAFMRAFGERSWYAPASLRRIYDRIGVSERVPAEPGLAKV
jgi:putative drug exporter of the RND superfamily